MTRVMLLVFILLSSLNAQPFGSPIHSTNQYINQLLFYRPYAQSPLIHDHLINIDISQSNIFQKSENLEADFGLTTLEFTYYVPLSKNLELSFNYPLYYVSNGFMDNGLDFIHNTLGIATTRENENHINNLSTYRVTDKIDQSGTYFASGNFQTELKVKLYDESDFEFSINGGIKIPIGSSDKGFTTSKVDFMSALQLQKTFEQIRWISNFSVTHNGTYELSEDISSQKFRYFFFLGNEFTIASLLPFITDHHHLLLGYTYSSAPYSSSDEKFNSYSHLLQFAYRYVFSNEREIDFFLNQNTIPRNNEADITLGLSFRF